MAPQRTSTTTEALPLPTLSPHATAFERLAMWIGVRLLIWSTRTSPDPAHERLIQHEQLHREAREHHYVRLLLDRSH